MTARRLIFHRDVELDLKEADGWYESQRDGLGQEFRHEFEAALTRVVERPEIGTAWATDARGGPVRKRALRRFPYFIAYELTAADILVLAVPHGHKRPGFWRDRIGA